MALNINGTTGISGVDGSVSAPAVTGTDSNTGITFPSADTIKFSTGGVERMSITNSGVSGITVGITEADQYRVTSNFSMGTTAANITTNWERVDNRFEKIGTGMSVDGNGRFTFPSAGIYLVSCWWHGQRATGATYSGTVYMHGTSNNFSSSSLMMDSFVGSGTNNEVNNAYMSCMFDVQDTSTHKCFFGYYDYHHGSMVFYGNTDTNYNAFTFIKLGDT